MKHVNVYEINRGSKTVAPSCSEVEFYQTTSLWMRQDAENWGNPPGTETMVRHRQRIIQVREEDGRDNYIACGPDLQRLLEVWADHDVLAKLEAKRAEVEDLLISQKIHLKAIDRHLADVRGLRSDLDHANLAFIAAAERLRNFREANVFIRIWRAIVGRL